MLKYILEVAQSIRLIDLIDIGVITIFIYLLLVWLKKARARFILIGMVILGSIYIFARVFLSNSSMKSITGHSPLGVL